jgi:peptidoglycan/LPS O-acetylase OafA/YrhL
MPAAPFPNLLVAVSVIATSLVIACLSGPYEILVVPTFAVLVYAVRNDESTIATLFLAKPLAFLGEISFSIYLVHYLVISIIGTILKVTLHAKPVPMIGWDTPVFEISPLLGDGLVATTVMCTLAIAKFTYRRIETPGRDLGNSLTKIPLGRTLKV